MSYLQRVFRATEDENRRTILRTLPPSRGGALLDVGTHTGEFAARVAAHLGASRVAGVELLPHHAEAARAHGIDVTCADVDAGLPFGNAEFDTVHANQIIEHVRRTDVLVREICRVLRPGGLALVSTNNLASWHNVASLALGLQPMPAHVSDEVIVGNPLNPEDGLPHEDVGRTHLRLFTPRALAALCGIQGLDVVVLRTVGYYPLPPRLGRLASRVDRLHGAFIIALLRRRLI